MTRPNPLKIIAAIALVSVLSSYGCILNPDEGEPDIPPVEIDWPDLTEKEHVVETIVLVHKYYRQEATDVLMDHYTRVLYDDPQDGNDYVWNMQEGDIISGYSPIMLRGEDIEGTRYILENASALNLELSSGTWMENTDVCAECWETTRTYTISATLYRNGENWTFNGVEMRVNYIIGPDATNPGHWTIYVASDLPGV